MENFDFYSPTYFAFGKERENEAGALIKKFGGSKVLLHFGGGSVIKSGLLDRVKKSLRKESIQFVELGGVQPNPRDSLVYTGIELCKNEKVDFILAVGGGSTIDSAKAIALGVPYTGDFWDFYEGTATAKAALPVATVLTIAAAGSEGSPSSVITKEDGMLKRGTGSDLIRPKFSILNPELTMTLPAYQIACGAADIMAHVFERYITNTKEVDFTDRLCEAVILTMKTAVPRAIQNPNDYEAQANIMWAGMVAHNDLVGVGRAQDWNSHDIEHELSALYDVPHGAGLAVIMPAWMTYVMNHNVMRFAQMAVRMWGCEMNFEYPERTAVAGIKAFKNFLSSIGLPVTLGELGADPKDIPYMVKNMGITEGYGFVPLSAKDVTEIYNLAK